MHAFDNGRPWSLEGALILECRSNVSKCPKCHRYDINWSLRNVAPLNELCHIAPLNDPENLAARILL